VKKLQAAELALLMLFSAAALAEESVVTLEPIPLEGDLTQARAYADAMEERFSVKILIGAECVDAIHPYSFTIGEGAPSRSPLMYLLNATFTDEELKNGTQWCCSII